MCIGRTIFVVLRFLPTLAIQLNRGLDLDWDKFSSTLHTSNRLPLFLPLSCRVITLPPQFTSVLLVYAYI